ncbi:MAG TPA: hypothetical protein VMB34_10745 [Acetobacteraceae bacterium]|nr:hypothetical protein [Acetobacteraceae bacterium]
MDHSETFAGASNAAIDRPHGHDRIAQPGFVGRRYLPGGVLLIGQNPGNDRIGKGRSEADLRQYEILHRLREAGVNNAESLSAELMSVLGSFVMPTWLIVRNVVDPLLAALHLELDEICYINLIKFRTLDSGIPSELYKKLLAAHSKVDRTAQADGDRRSRNRNAQKAAPPV